MRSLSSKRFRGQRGQSLIETALMIVVIFTVVFWVFELGWLMYTYNVMADAANEGVRHAIVTSGGDASGTVTIVKNFAATSLHDISHITVSVTFPNGNATPPNPVVVSVTYTYVPWLRGVINTPTMTTYAQGTMVVQ